MKKEIAKKKKYLLRRTAEYSLIITANSEEEAEEIANNTDFHNGTIYWGDIKVDDYYGSDTNEDSRERYAAYP